jgi:predicted nucleotidyltransferase
MFKENWIIYKVKSGSQAYGTNLPSSDLDIKGVAIPDLEYYFSYFKRFEQHETKSPQPDSVIYELRKFIDMAANCNPNIIEVLNADANDVLQASELGLILRSNASLFLTAKAKHTFTGYAASQMKRIKNHKKWNDTPPPKPQRKDYHLPEANSLMSFSELNSIDMEFGFNKDKNPSADVRELIAKKHGEEKATAYYYEKQYRVAMREYENYESWKVNRNKERHSTEVQFGYDTKHAMHTVRLLRMGKEILTEGIVRVKRPDAEELISIRLGAWSYDRLLEEAERLDSECISIYENKTYVVPHSPNASKIDDLCISILKKRFL